MPSGDRIHFSLDKEDVSSLMYNGIKKVKWATVVIWKGVRSFIHITLEESSDVISVTELKVFSSLTEVLKYEKNVLE